MASPFFLFVFFLAGEDEGGRGESLDPKQPPPPSRMKPRHAYISYIHNNGTCMFACVD